MTIQPRLSLQWYEAIIGLAALGADLDVLCAGLQERREIISAQPRVYPI